MHRSLIFLFLNLVILNKQSFGQPQLVLPFGHSDLLNRASFSPDSKYIVSCSNDFTAIVWEVNSGKRLFTLRHDKSVESVSFSPDGSHIITTGQDYKLKVWDAETGSFLYEFGDVDPGYPSITSRDGNWAAFISNNDSVIVFSLSSGNQQCYIPFPYSYRVTQVMDFSWDSQKIVVLNPREVVIWNIATNKQEHAIKTTRANCVKALPKLNVLQVGTTDGKLDLYDLADFELVKSYSIDKNSITSLYNTPDNSSSLLAIKGKGVYITDSLFRDPLWLDNDFDEETGQSAISPNGNWVAEVDLTEEFISIYNNRANDSFYLDIYVTEDDLIWFEWSPNEKYFLLVDLFGIRIWDIESKTIRRTINESPKLDPDFLTGYSDLRQQVLIPSSIDSYINLSIIDITNATIVQQIPLTYQRSITEGQQPGGTINSHTQTYTVKQKDSLGKNPRDYSLLLFETSTGKLIKSLDGHTSYLEDIKFSFNDSLLATASCDRTIRIWDTRNGNCIRILKGHTDVVKMVSFSTDNRLLLSVSYDGTAIIWDLKNSQHQTIKIGEDLQFGVFSTDKKTLVLQTLKKTFLYTIESKEVSDFSLSPHLSQLRIGLERFSNKSRQEILFRNPESGPFEFTVWDYKTLKPHFRFALAHTGTINSVCWKYDDTQVLTASDDSTIAVWDVQAKKLIKRIGLGSMVIKAKFTPDGKHFVALTKSGLSLWNIATWSKELAYSSSVAEDVTIYPESDAIYSWGRIKHFWFSPDGNYMYCAKNLFSNYIIFPVYRKEEPRYVNYKFIAFVDSSRKILSGENNSLQLSHMPDLKLHYNFGIVNKSDILAWDAEGRYDGPDGARKAVYFVCGKEIIDLDQVKDSLWIDGLVEKIVSGKKINSTRLHDINICGLTPVVESLGEINNSFRFKVTPRRGGLTETVLYVNNIEVNRYKPGEMKKINEAYELDVKKEDLNFYFLTGKENFVSVKAYTTGNSISSRSVSILYQDKTSQTITPNLYAIMVGVSDYKGEELDLKFPGKDAEDLSNVIAASAGKMLNIDGKSHVFIYNANTAGGNAGNIFPYKESIKNILEDSIGKKANANDILFIFFAGHGIVDEADKQFKFLTADASKNVAAGISIPELFEWTRPQVIKAQKRIFILDACNSGQALKDLVSGSNMEEWVGTRSDEKTKQVKAIDKLNERSGMFILSASASDQKAYEYGKYSQGILTYALLKVLKEEGRILDEGKYLNVGQWFIAAKEKVVDLVRSIKARQDPQVASSGNFNIGIIDADVMKNIILKNEIPLFGATKLTNIDPLVLSDDLELGIIIDKDLDNYSSLDNNAPITFVSATISPEAYTISGIYEIKGSRINCRFNLKQNGKTKDRFEITGTKTDLQNLAKKITKKILTWLQ